MVADAVRVVVVWSVVVPVVATIAGYSYIAIRDVQSRFTESEYAVATLRELA